MLSVVHSTKSRSITLLIFLGGLNLLTWIWAFVVFDQHPALIGTALLAWTYGLRHAVDADHIAAIDNVTRKMMQQGKMPVSVGAFFSFGHSTIVILAALAVGLAAGSFGKNLGWIHNVGSTIGTCVSALFLLILAVINFFIFKDIWQRYQQVKRNGYSASDTTDMSEPTTGGQMSWIYGRLFKFINHSWQMYLVGFLFGLGFDTATEVGVLAISATTSSNGLSLSAILVFPALFAAGMAFVDSMDNAIMVKAYGWAFEQPFRKLYYNLTITASSLAIALIIGGFEAMGLLVDQMGWDHGVGHWVIAVNDQLGNIGFWIIGLMVLCWIISVCNYRLRGYHHLTVNQ